MLTEAEKKQIVEMARKGLGPVEIAEKLGVSAQRVAGFMARAQEQGLLFAKGSEFDGCTN